MNRANHPHAVVYNESSNLLLQQAIDTAEGRNPPPLMGKGGDQLPPMPQKGEVDFIFGGQYCLIKSDCSCSYHVIRSPMPEFLHDESSQGKYIITHHTTLS